MATISPAARKSFVTAPSRGARISCSIFIASSSRRAVPFVTWSPSETRTFTTRPGIGAVRSCSSSGAPAGRSATRSTRQVSPR